MRRKEVQAATVARVCFDFLAVSAGLILLVLGRQLVMNEDIDRMLIPGAVGGAVILGSISVNAFSIRGFYRQNRMYRPRHKVRAIVQAVLISHLIFGFVLLLLWDVIDFPRSVLLPSAAVSAVVLSAARIGSHRIPALSRFIDRLDERSAEPDHRHVLVVGGAGYIGSALVPKLLERGYRVRVLDRLMFGSEPLAAVLDHPDLELMVGDFQDVATVVAATAGVDAIVHLGAIVGDPACDVDQDLTRRTNFLATRMLAEVAKSAGIRRFVFASTCSVYGAGDELLDEKSALRPVSLYARTKIACEETLAELTDADFRPTNLRFGTIFGLSGRTRFDLVVNLLSAKALVDGEITVFGGDQWRPFVHVDDAASGVFAALEQPLAVVGGQTYNIGSDENNHTIDDVAAIINRVVPEARIVSGGFDGDRRNYRVSFAKARRDLGLRAAWSIEDGVRQVLEAIRSGAVADYGDSRYSNLKSLKQNGEAVAPLDRGDANPRRMVLGYSVDLSRSAGAWTEIVLRDDGQVTVNGSSPVS